jgi:hypothetical protein
VFLLLLLYDQEKGTQINSTWVWVDSTAAIADATGPLNRKNDFTHETVKHVTVEVRFLQECVQREILLLVYIKAGKYISDIMTKQSPGPQFIQHHNCSLGMIDDRRHRGRNIQRCCYLAPHSGHCLG